MSTEQSGEGPGYQRRKLIEEVAEYAVRKTVALAEPRIQRAFMDELIVLAHEQHADALHWLCDEYNIRFGSLPVDQPSDEDV